MIGRRFYNPDVRWIKYGAAAASVAAITLTLRVLGIESDGMAATLFLLDVVVLARLGGLGAALVTAACGSGAFSYYFLPPAGFRIEDPEDWTAFIVFTVTAVLAGELASRAERRAAEAQAGRQEIERLYQELQAAFERASDAEAARRNEQLKAALLDALTHNLRTPLTSIKASVTALIRAGAWTPISALTSEGRKDLLQVIDEESDRLNRFIEGLSTAAEKTEAAQPVHLRAVAVEAIVKASLSRAETLTRDHRLTVDIADNLPRLSVDEASIIEVLYILLDNASKYAPTGSCIAVRARSDGDRHVRISVADEGPGIPKELHERVFEKFFRVPTRQPQDPRRGGAGLGLPIARRLVEAQGGWIWVDPIDGRGTSMSMTLPVAIEGEAVNDWNSGGDRREVARAGSGR